jgi:hypothetical protein
LAEVLEARLVLDGTPSILFLGSAATPTFQADGAVYSYLQTTFGAESVSYKQASATNNTTDLSGVDVLVLSSTPGSGDYRNKFHNSAIPILNWEEAVMDANAGEFGLSSAAMIKSTTTTQATVVLDHPITAGLSGTVNFVSSGAETLTTGALYPGLTALAVAANGTATTGGASVVGNPMLFIAEAGQNVDPLSGASPAKGRRVMFPITDATFNSLTPAGQQLFANSIVWLAGLDAVPPEVHNLAAQNVGAVSADLMGEVTAGGANTTVTVYYGDNDGGAIAGQWDHVIDLGTQAGGYSVTIEELIPQTNYYFTSRAVNDQGETWAMPSESFVTPALSLPAVLNLPADNIGSTYATAVGEVTSTGNDVPSITLYWGDNDGGTTVANWDFAVNLGQQSGSFETLLSGLDAQAPYYYRALAQNAAGSVWAPSTQSFTTISATLDDVVMFNDHVVGGITHVNATTYSANGLGSGPLRNFATGQATPITLTTAGVAINYAGASEFPADGTDAYDLFDGIIDFSTGTGTSLELAASTNSSYTHTFSDLDIQSVYEFAGTAIRGNDAYTNRWTLVTLVGADGFTAEHSAGDGVITAGLAPNQAALWVGANHNPGQGFVVRWSDIDPGDDGTFSVVQTQYTGTVPTTIDAGGVANGSKGYGLTAIRLVQSFDAFTVVQSSPAAGEVFAQPPNFATLDFNLAVDAGSLNAADLTVNGVAATAVQLIDADTVRWTLPSLSAGDYTMVIAPEAIASIDGPVFVGFQSPFSIAVAPQVATSTATSITATSARIGAQLVSTGFDDPNVTLYWGTSDGGTNPANWQHSVDLGTVGAGTHRTTIDALDPNTTYFFRALAENVAGSVWATSSQSFSTVSAQVPTVVNQPAGNVSAFSAELRGSVTSTGNDTPQVTVFYGTSDGGTNAAGWEQSVEVGEVGGAFSTIVTGLLADTEYHFRARATNIAGTAWANATSIFTTSVLPPVMISELLASNGAGLTTRVRTSSAVPFAGNALSPDWIELQNPTTNPVDLGGFHLTDDPDDPVKWTFPPGTILPASGQLVVFASGRNLSDLALDERGLLHTNFVLDASGEYLALTGSDGAVVFEYAPDFPAQRSDKSYGVDAAGEFTYFRNPTPGAANDLSSSFVGYVTDTSFSVDRGFYETVQDVVITSSTPGATIVYTTNGSVPTLTNGTSVSASGPDVTPSASVSISTTTTLRAAAFKTGFEPTNVDTHTYLFLDDVVHQPNNPAGFPTSWGGAPAVDYEMDPDVVNDATLPATVREALTSIPTLSLVGSVQSLFGSTGLYSNTSNTTLEVVTSAEWILPDGSRGFQLDAGLNLQGGASRTPGNSPKHSFSLRFRDAYGAGKLDYPLFEDSPVDSFNTLQLRAMYNNSWIHWDAVQRSRGTLIRDQFFRDSLLDMGQDDAGRGTYAHLYLNGLYWGIYNVHERAEASHYAAYNGGDGDDYDALNGGNPVDGTLASYNAMKATVATRDWDAIQEVLDVDNYIDWTIIQRYGSNNDLKADGNWRAAGGGVVNGKWRFYAWDSERVLEGVTEATPTPVADPIGILSTLQQIEEFRIRFADRIQQHFFNGGALTPESTVERFNERATELRTAILAESARWGDYRRDVHQRNCGCTLYGLNNYWDSEVNRLLTSYFPRRSDIVVDQYRTLGLFPNVAAPEFAINGLVQYGGEISAGADLALSGPVGATIYYTLDGSDPRAVGGAAAGLVYRPGIDPPIQLDQSTTVRARSLVGATWSALDEATFLVVPTGGAVILSEINYHPYDPTATELAQMSGVAADDFEFVEIRNTHPSASINLVDMQLTSGVTFTFPNAVLAAGESAVVVENETAFRLRYGDGVHVLGEWSGSLSNSGENVTLADGLGNVTFEIDYRDSRLWAERADGLGATLEIVETGFDSVAAYNRHDRWRGSVDFGGSPGSDGTATLGIVINEVLANSGGGGAAMDAIELFNSSMEVVDLSGWYLSDSASDLFKYVIPDGTQLGPGKHFVIDESKFNPTPATPGPRDFALSGSRGDDVYLTISDGTGGVQAFVDEMHFGGSATGVSFGRVVGGTVEAVPLSRPTLGCENSVGHVGSFVFSEVNYQPGMPSAAALALYPEMTSSDLEYLEVYNPTLAAIDLTDWRIRGEVDYDFPSGTTLEAGATIVVASFNFTNIANASRTAAFFAHYGIDATSGIPAGFLGGYSGSLSNREASVRLERPDDPPADDPSFTPHVTEDYIYYNNVAPWSASTAGQGDALGRLHTSGFGALSTTWGAEEPSPGDVSFVVGPTGDFDGDGSVTAADIDLLYDVIRSGRELEQFDVDANGVVDAADAHFLVTEVLETVFGDANLDGVVDVSDFNRWNAAKFQSCATSWSHGNFNGDLAVDATDFNLWMSPFRPQAAATSAAASGRNVPRAALGQAAEPAPLVMIHQSLGMVEQTISSTTLNQHEVGITPHVQDAAARHRVPFTSVRSFNASLRRGLAASVVRREPLPASLQEVDVKVLDGVWQDW